MKFYLKFIFFLLEEMHLKMWSAKVAAILSRPQYVRHEWLSILDIIV